MLVEENVSLKSRVADLEAKIAEMSVAARDPAAAIEKALDAQYVYNANSMGGGGFPYYLFGQPAGKSEEPTGK